MDGVASNAPLVGIGVLAGAFLVLAMIERLAPRRPLRFARPHRWFTNLSFFAIDTALVRLAIPLLMVGVAGVAAERGWGLLNNAELPTWAEYAAAFALLDLAIFLQHWATHRVPLLWRLHKVHHTDPDFDVTTAARFHPLEIMLSMLYKMACVALIGPAVLAVVIFEIGFNALTLFTHANFSLPHRIDRLARLAIVTPDMHRIHHSAAQRETDSNYGTFLSLWDRLFGTYVDKAAKGQDGMTIGLSSYQDERPVNLGWSLLLPFRRKDAGDQPS